MTPKFKEEIRSFAHTFLSVFIPIVALTISNTDITTLTRDGAVAIFIAAVRSSIKALSTLYFPPKE